MKTLDEVIEAIGFCKSGNLSKCKDCPYIGTCELDYAVLSDDALHYLREYRDKHDEMLKTEEALGYCEMAENRPLTWDELCTMEGKPVWVEIENNDPVWAIPMGISTLGDNERMCMVGAEGGHAIHVEVAKDSVNGWQAYRKERS